MECKQVFVVLWFMYQSMVYEEKPDQNLDFN